MKISYIKHNLERDQIFKAKLPHGKPKYNMAIHQTGKLLMYMCVNVFSVRFEQDLEDLEFVSFFTNSAPANDKLILLPACLTQ